MNVVAYLFLTVFGTGLMIYMYFYHECLGVWAEHKTPRTTYTFINMPKRFSLVNKAIFIQRHRTCILIRF